MYDSELHLLTGTHSIMIATEGVVLKFTLYNVNKTHNVATTVWGVVCHHKAVLRYDLCGISPYIIHNTAADIVFNTLRPR